MNPHANHSRTQITRYEALAAADGTGMVVSPVAMLVEQAGNREGLPRVLAMGHPAEVCGHEAWAGARPDIHPGCVLLPGLVNAHTHLDLTHLGPRPLDPAAGFMGWVEMIRTGRHLEEPKIADSVRRGIELSLAGGVVAVGDIAGAAGGRPCFEPLRVLQESPLLGVSYLEFFGIGTRLEVALSRIEEWAAELARQDGGNLRIRPGLQPHAPNSVDLRLYIAAAEQAGRRGMPISTHLAETVEEREFVARGTGSQRRFLEELGLWSDSVLERVGRGLHPVGHLAAALERARFLVAHVNDCDDEAIATLARTGTSVAYCPRASEYFGAGRKMGPHRYREMLAAGVNVCLGTDSIVNLPASAADAARGGMSVLDEARLLFRRDGIEAGQLLRMATINGALALGLSGDLFRFRDKGDIAGLAAVEIGPTRGDFLEAVFRSDAPATLLARRGSRPVSGRGDRG